MNTYMAKGETVERKWYVVDAEGMVLGRLASQVAAILRGKNKPIYTPHVDTGDHVIIVNADKVVLTGNKLDKKKYYRFLNEQAGGYGKYRLVCEDSPGIYKADSTDIKMEPTGGKGWYQGSDTKEVDFVLKKKNE